MNGIGEFIMSQIERGDRRDSAQAALQTIMGSQGQDQAGQAPAGGGGFDPTTDPAGEGPTPMDQHETLGKRADAIRNVLSSYNPDPQVKTALKAKSLGELEGMLKGYALNATMQEHAARAADYRSQAQLRDQQALDDKSVGEGMTRFANADPSLSPDAKFKLAISGVSGRAAPKLLQALSAYTQSQGDTITGQKEIYPGATVLTTRKGNVQVVTDPAAKNADANLEATYTEDPVTGARTLLYGKTAQPTGFNATKAHSTLEPLHDQDGNLVAWGARDPRGHATIIPNKQGPLRAAKDEEGNAIPGYYQAPNGDLLDTRSVLQKHLGAGDSAAPAAAPMPKTKDAMVKGKLYVTPRGVAKWDGKQFVPQ